MFLMRLNSIDVYLDDPLKRIVCKSELIFCGTFAYVLVRAVLGGIDDMQLFSFCIFLEYNEISFQCPEALSQLSSFSDLPQILQRKCYVNIKMCVLF